MSRSKAVPVRKKVKPTRRYGFELRVEVAALLRHFRPQGVNPALSLYDLLANPFISNASGAPTRISSRESRIISVASPPTECDIGREI
jgi:hypothetical protein